MNTCTGELRRRLCSGRILVCGQVNDARSSATVEVFREVGYDVLVIDLEHSALTIETVADHIRVARALGLICVVRVATPEYGSLNRVLDQGADGVFVPRVRSAEEVKQIVKMIHYPPIGVRGLGGRGCPVSRYGGWPTLSEQIDTVNRNLALGIQIETQEALDGLEEILAVPGVDMAVIGSDDLSTALRIPGQFGDERLKKAAQRVIEVCRRNGVVPGIACGTPTEARDWIARGMRILWYGLDIYLLWEGASRRINGLRRELAGTEYEHLWP